MGMYVGVRIDPESGHDFAGESVCQIRKIDERTKTAVIVLWMDTEREIIVQKNILQNYYGFIGSDKKYVSDSQEYKD